MMLMGSDHRSIMAQFVIPAPKKRDSPKGPIVEKEELRNGEHHGPERQKHEHRKDTKSKKKYNEIERKIMKQFNVGEEQKSKACQKLN